MKKLKNEIKNNKGITLVALIITIIILLILAGVAISQLTDSGLFGKAKLAKQKQENSEAIEDDRLKQYENAIINVNTRNPKAGNNSSDEYSTNEKVIGTWIDGKTLYQKTINCGTMTSREMSVAHNISNIENVIDLCGIYTMPNEYLVVSYSSQAGNTWNIRLSATSTNIILTFGSSFSVQGTTCVTIKYTKTTDIAPNSNN